MDAADQSRLIAAGLPLPLLAVHARSTQLVSRFACPGAVWRWWCFCRWRWSATTRPIPVAAPFLLLHRFMRMIRWFIRPMSGSTTSVRLLGAHWRPMHCSPGLALARITWFFRSGVLDYQLLRRREIDSPPCECSAGSLARRRDDDPGDCLSRPVARTGHRLRRLSRGAGQKLTLAPFRHDRRPDSGGQRDARRPAALHRLCPHRDGSLSLWIASLPAPRQRQSHRIQTKSAAAGKAQPHRSGRLACPATLP